MPARLLIDAVLFLPGKMGSRAMSVGWQDNGDRISLEIADTSMTIRFEHIDTGPTGLVPIENGFAGLSWLGFYAVRPASTDFEQESGYYTGVVSGEQAGVNYNSKNCDVYVEGGTFDFIGVTLTSVWNIDQRVRVFAIRDGHKVGNYTINVNNHDPLTILVGFDDIEILRFRPKNGKHDPTLEGDGNQIIIDDLRVEDIRVPVASDATSVAHGFSLDSGNSGHFGTYHPWLTAEVHLPAVALV